MVMKLEQFRSKTYNVLQEVTEEADGDGDVNEQGFLSVVEKTRLHSGHSILSYRRRRDDGRCLPPRKTWFLRTQTAFSPLTSLYSCSNSLKSMLDF